MTLNLFRMEVMVERLFHSWHHFLFIPCRGVKTPAFIRMQQRRQHIRSAAHPAPRRHLQFDTRNRRIGAKHQQSRALGRLGLIDAGRTAPLRARQSVLSECADSMYRGIGCVVRLITCDRSQCQAYWGRWFVQRLAMACTRCERH